MRENGAKVVTAMLDVQFKIIWKLSENRPLLMITIGKTDLIDSIILPTILLQFIYILGLCQWSQSNAFALYTIPDI